MVLAQRLDIPKRRIDRILTPFRDPERLVQLEALVARSFLGADAQAAYLAICRERWALLAR